MNFAPVIDAIRGAHTRVDLAPVLFCPLLAEVEQVEAKAGVAPVLAAIQQNKTLVDFAPASNCIASGIARRPSVLGRTKQPDKALERLANVQQLGLEPDGFMRHAAISTCGKASSLTRHRAPGRLQQRSSVIALAGSCPLAHPHVNDQ